MKKTSQRICVPLLLALTLTTSLRATTRTNNAGNNAEGSAARAEFLAKTAVARRDSPDAKSGFRAILAAKHQTLQVGPSSKLAPATVSSMLAYLNISQGSQVAATSTSWNPAVLNVSWASDFNSIVTNQINVRTDSRLSPKAVGDGVADDTAAVTAAVALASSTGGGVVYFPAGSYKIYTPGSLTVGRPLIIPSRVILRGAGPTTSLIYVNDENAALETDWVGTWGGIAFLAIRGSYPFVGSRLTGMTDIGVYGVSSTAPYAVVWNRSSKPGTASEVFFNNVSFHLNRNRPFWFEQIKDVLVQNSTFDSTSVGNYTAGIPAEPPVFMVGETNLSFINNKVTYHVGRVHLMFSTNMVIQGNTFLRDAQNNDMENLTAIESGGVELSFDNGVQFIDNTLQTSNAPSNEAADGEAVGGQLSNIQDIQDAGSVTAITSTTLTDAAAQWGPVTLGELAQYPGEVVAMLSGAATGQLNAIQSIDPTTKTITFTKAWSTVPSVGDLYSIFNWPMQNVVIQGNTFLNNPQGIIIFDGCYNCLIQKNTLTNSGGIKLRVVDQMLGYPESRRQHEVTINDQILSNTIINTTGIRPAYIALNIEAFGKDGTYHGVGEYNVQIGGNSLTFFVADPNRNYNVGSTDLYHEGLFPCFMFKGLGSKPNVDPLTAVFQKIYEWENSQSAPVSYDSYFSTYATSRDCVTASAPDLATAPVRPQR